MKRLNKLGGARNLINFEYVILFSILFFSLFFLYAPPHKAAKMDVVPDSVEYSITAYNLFNGKGFNIEINNEKYRARSLIGYPLLIIPFYFFFGSFIGNAVFSSLFFALGSLILVYFIAKRIFNKYVAFLSILILLTSKLFAIYSILIMTEVASIFFILLIFYLFIKLKLNKVNLFIIGSLLGFSATIRFTNILILIPLFFLFFFMKFDLKKLKNSIWFFFGTFFFLIPYFILNKIIFNGFLRTGANYWISYWYDYNLFSFEHILGYNIDSNMPNLIFYLKQIFGFGDFYSFFVVLFVFVGFYLFFKNYRIMKDKEIRLFFFSIIMLIVYFLFYIVHFAQNDRYLMIIIPFFSIIAAYAFYYFFNFKSKNLLRKVLTIFFIFLFVIHFFSFIISNYKAIQYPIPVKYEIVKFMQLRQGYFISSIDGAYISHFTDLNYIPLFNGVEYTDKIICEEKPVGNPPGEINEYRKWALKNGCRKANLKIAVENIDYIKELIENGKNVYIDSYSCFLYPQECRKLTFNINIIEKNNIFEIYQLQ